MSSKKMQRTVIYPEWLIDGTGADALVLLTRRELSRKDVEVAVPAAKSKPSAVDTAATTATSLAARLSSHPLSKAPQKLLALDVQEQIDASRRKSRKHPKKHAGR